MLLTWSHRQRIFGERNGSGEGAIEPHFDRLPSFARPLRYLWGCWEKDERPGKEKHMMESLSVDIILSQDDKISSLICSIDASQSMRSILNPSNKKPRRFKSDRTSMWHWQRSKVIVLRQGVKRQGYCGQKSMQGLIPDLSTRQSSPAIFESLMTYSPRFVKWCHGTVVALLPYLIKVVRLLGSRVLGWVVETIQLDVFDNTGLVALTILDETVVPLASIPLSFRHDNPPSPWYQFNIFLTIL